MARILVADDDELLVSLVEFTLTHRGHQVLKAEDGAEALDLIHKEHPDLVVLDGMMPGLDGLEVLKSVRAEPKTADLPVIMLTARKREEDVLGGLSSGANDYLVKPFMPEELAVRIQKTLAGRTA